MLWFKGSVSEAIAESRRIGSLFIVYIKGDDEHSRKMDAVWENEKIKEVCLSDCTAIRLLANSNELQQFSSIYPVVCIPCTYFLDGAGTPLEVIAVSLPIEQFLDKIQQTIQKHRAKFPKVECLPQATVEQSESLPSTSSQSNASTSSGPDEGSGNSEQALADRVSRAKKLIEQKKKEKAEKEKEDARRKEVERRNEGQRLSKAKAEREEMLAQQMADRIRTEKAKDKAAKDAIRQKIVQDKAERAAKEEVQKRERLQAAARIDPRLDQNKATVQCVEVRLQFRLPDGSTVTDNFPPDTALDTAREFICSRMNFKKSVTFWTTFPRKHFGEEDFARTLSELGLAPSAALIVDTTSPSMSNSSTNSSSSVFSILSLILAPFLALFSFIKLLLFASPQPRQGAVQQDTNRATITSTAASTSSSSSEVRKRTKDDQNEDRFKKDGKIHSFKQSDNDDDENNTWNGNSTQQM